MKKLFIIAILFILLIPGVVFAVGTVTQSLENSRNTNSSTLTFTWTADAAAATVPSTATSAAITTAIEGLCIYHVVTNPGATAPTDNYDIVLNDTDGIDMMGGTLVDRDTSTSELAIPLLNSAGSVYGCRMVNGSITMVLTNNAVNSAVGVIKVFLKRP